MENFNIHYHPHNLCFREATVDDVDAIIELVRMRIQWMDNVGLEQWNKTDYFGRYPREYWAENIHSFLVGDAEGRVVVAMALYVSDVRWGEMPDEAYYLHHLVSSQDCPGAGHAMMQYVEHYAKAHGIGILRLDSAVGNAALERFYTRLGYKESGRCRDRLYYGILREKRL